MALSIAPEDSSVDEILANLRKYVEIGNRSVDNQLLEKLKTLDWDGIEALINLIVDVVCEGKTLHWFWKVARQIRLRLCEIDDIMLKALEVDRYHRISDQISSIFSIFKANIEFYVTKDLSSTPPYIFLYLELRIIEQQLADYSDQSLTTSALIQFTRFYTNVDNYLLNKTINKDPSQEQLLRRKQNEIQDSLWELSGYRDNRPFDLYIYLVLDLLSTIIQDCEDHDHIQRVAYLKIAYSAAAIDYNRFTYGLQDYINQLLNHVDQTNLHGEDYHPHWLIAKYVQDAAILLGPNNQLSRVVWGCLKADLQRILTKIDTYYITMMLKHLDLESDNYGSDQIDGTNQRDSNTLIISLPSNISHAGIQRHEELQLIDQHFSESYQWSMSQIAITGLGGAGKTYVAYQYALMCIDQNRYDIVYWLHAETIVSLQNSLISLARTIAETISPDHPYYQEPSLRELHDEFKRNSQEPLITVSGMDQKVLTAKGSPTRVHELISLCSKVLQHCHQLKFLLIYDNADNIQLVTSYIPSSGNSHVIITSRNKNWPNIIDIGPFNRQTSIEYLKTEFSKGRDKYKASTSSKADLNKLAALLGDLPLALSFATRYIKRYNVTIAAYVKEFKKEVSRIWDQKYAPIEYKQYGQSEQDHSQVVARQKTIMTTWTISMESFRAKGELSCYIIEYFAYIRPDNIPKRLIMDLTTRLVNNDWWWSFRQQYQDIFNRLFKSDYTIKNSQFYIDLLVDTSLVYEDNDNYSVHRLLQHAVRTKIKQENREREVLYALLSYFDSDPEIDVDMVMHARQCCYYRGISNGDSKLSSLFDSVTNKVDRSLKSQASDTEVPAGLEFDIVNEMLGSSDNFESEYSRYKVSYFNLFLIRLRHFVPSRFLNHLRWYTPKGNLVLPSLLAIVIDQIINELF